MLGQIPDYFIIKFSRGCPNRCSYCAVPFLEGHTLRYRSLEDVVDEISEKVQKFGIKKVVFWESNILYNAKKHFELLLDLIIKRNLNIVIDFPEGFSPGLLYEELLYKMMLAGVKNIRLALESISDDTLTNRFKKKTKFSHFVKASKIIKKVFLSDSVFVYIMAGMPRQRTKEVEETVKSVLNFGFIPYLMPFTPIPRTKEYNIFFRLIKNKRLEQLHPMLWPCVDKSSEYSLLSDMHMKCLKLVENLMEVDYPQCKSVFHL